MPFMLQGVHTFAQMSESTDEVFYIEKGMHARVRVCECVSVRFQPKSCELLGAGTGKAACKYL